MKKLLYLFIFLFFTTCKKQDRDNPNTQPAQKNYLQTSYELQKSAIKIDLVALRNKFGNTSGFILAIAYFDINGDGHDDIFVNPGSGNNDRSNAEMYIYKNGDYVFDNSYFNSPSSMVHPRKALAGDFNNDKKPDVFITGHGYDQPPFPGEYNQMLISTPTGKYDLKSFPTKVGFYHGACSGDIDNDGDLDVFVLGGPSSYFLINDGKGNFTISTDPIDVNGLAGQYHCELVDIDKDGYLDLMLGGHEMNEGNTTQILWGNNSFKFSYSNKTDLPAVDYYGVITDLDIADIDGDGKNEVAITRTGGKWINNNISYFYSGWAIQIVKLNNKLATDITSNAIENNAVDYAIQSNWIAWMRFEDYDNNGKIDFFSTKCGGASFVRWELRSGKLIRIN